MYSFHSSPEEKNRLLFALTQHGIETTVDRVAKKKRIRDWIQESVIQEEDDEEEEANEDEGQELQTRTSRAPVAGHVSSVRAAEKAARSQIVSTVKDAANKHINPRTGKVQQGPSEMGHQSNDTQTSSHYNGNNDRQINHNSHIKESRRENNGHEHPGIPRRRSAKLVDVGSQTSSESQKQLEAAMTAAAAAAAAASSGPINNVPISMDKRIIKNSQSVPSISQKPNLYSNRNAQSTQTNHSRMDTSSRGYVSAFNSLATIVVPEVQQSQQMTKMLHPVSSMHRERERELSQPRQSYQHRHNTTVLTKQPMSRSVHNFNSLINDSGYGSLDKLRPIDNTQLSSPILSKRSTLQTNLMIPSNGTGPTCNERIHINGLSHSQNECSSPFHSDSGGDGSPRGSNGFVNLTGLKPVDSPRITMKDTAYDHIRSSRKKQ